MKAEAWFIHRATQAELEAGTPARLVRESFEIDALAPIERHQHIHTHYARYSQGWQAIAFADGNGWLPPRPEQVYSFEEIPRLAEDYLAGKTDYFPTFSINDP